MIRKHGQVTHEFGKVKRSYIRKANSEGWSYVYYMKCNMLMGYPKTNTQTSWHMLVI